jgi:hypothetical protein
MSGHDVTKPLSYEDHIIELEEALTKTKNDLSKMSLLLGKAYVFTCNTRRENHRLKKRIEELEFELELNHKADETISVVALTQEHLHHQHRADNSPPMSPVSVPTSPRVHHHRHPQHPEHPEHPQPQYHYQCSMAMACCDGLYFAPLRDRSSPPRLSPDTPDTPETPDTPDTTEHQQHLHYDDDERIITRDGKKYRLRAQYGINGHCWMCEEEIPNSQDQSKLEDEYETDPVTYWQKAYPEWEHKYSKDVQQC